MTRLLAPILSLALVAAACGGDRAAPPAGDAAAAAAPTPTGRVIEVKAISEGARHYFEPDRIEAKQGDLIRLVLVSGVHNLAWPPAQNPSGATLPPATDMLQLPGQTADVPVSMGPGDYKFVCVPHEALGMVGTLTVTR